MLIITNLWLLKKIWLHSQGGAEVTFIDGEGTRQGIKCNDGETALTHIDGFTIQNDGNTNLSITLVSNLAAADFIQDGAALFLWNVSVSEPGSCVNATGSRKGVEPNTTGAGCDGIACGAIFEAVSTTTKNICPSLLFDDASDQLDIDINITIPVTSPSGTKTAILTITGAREPAS